ncbi:chemotaxis protein CheW [Endozoicomonas euniceicola]|uniref:Chemotaxis protein CheW n=1 Tax=Endozoicomonas euniceicola TaxID=1234143 RepID=A0ABY6GZG0_9GAMM|nr:chemotaxis protein CheW [Endozoicomonas euniceicola]UYM18060.1 chemotaxis protein CheW [Endozoicomonas euniceicola]
MSEETAMSGKKAMSEKTAMPTPTDEKAPASNNKATVLKPFELLQQMQTQVVLHAQEPPECKQPTAPWVGIGFRLNQRHYVAGIEDITEVLPVPTITPLPGTKSWAKGLSNVHGRLVPIIDLPEFLGLPTPSGRNIRRIMVVSCQQMPVGLIVDEVQGMVHFPSECFTKEALTTTADSTDTVNYFTEGCYSLEKKYPVFSINKLVNHSDFLMAVTE